MSDVRLRRWGCLLVYLHPLADGLARVCMCVCVCESVSVYIGPVADPV